MYYLQNNVEIVSGAKRHCIYNLGDRKEYTMIECLTDQNVEPICQTCPVNSPTCSPNSPTCNPRVPTCDPNKP